MWTRIVWIAAIVASVTAPLAAAGTPKALYETALAREHAVRARLSEGEPSASVLKEIRAVENAYLAVVRQHPASSYSDNALWNAGQLALDAFAKFGHASDRETGIRLLNLLAAHYPTSKLAKRVPPAVNAVPAATAATAPTPASAAPTTTAAPATPAIAAAAVNVGSPRSTIKSVSRTVLPDVVRVTIEMDVETPFHEERLDGPPRVFIDFPATRAAPALVDKTLRFDGDADIVRQIRIGRHPNQMTRVVLDAAGITGYSVYPLYNPYRLVIDCARATAGRPVVARAEPAMGGEPASRVEAVARSVSRPPAPQPAGRPVSRADATPKLLTGMRLSTNWGRTLPSVSPTAAAALQGARAETAVADATPPTPAAPLAPPALVAPPARNSAGGFSIARQLGLGVSRIVIDPGHGGHDPGAKGKGVTEAELVLDVALRLEKLLQQQPGVEVMLTRRTDDFIPLPERTAIANREGADLFLSIHANASPNPQAHGVETYFLNFANNLSAAAVAARENAASGQGMGALPDFVKAIALNNKLDESRDFAAEIQREMIGRLRGQNRSLKDLGVKQAPFVVLIGAAMPSVLAEISFVTNPQEAKLLRSSAYRQKIAEALVTAVRKYQASLHAIGKVAAQQ